MFPEPTPPPPRPDELGRALADALVTGGSTVALERIVRSYVRDLKGAGLPPEQTLLRVKDALGLSRLSSLHTPTPLPSDQLAREVLGWFVAEYYRAD